ncbi:sigma-70 family RNA polymerase sigma factor [Nannocystis exedens]|uniref:sigma-70 family RNA polymerase sigma factor n=1 Tax=Nannocystis exedens TaxID=54 RepID=UPI000BB9FD4E|nr:sigma-70 family RNA polymerase sigma factor [Nannocystis exedens]PCC73798.1 RNA polymerase sigma factor SigY [Nannocystis exedens]
MPSRPPDRIAAFAAFFRAYYTYVHQNLRRLGVPPAAVEDAAQEVFLVVLRRADAPITNVRGWLFGIVRRIAWRFRRGASRRDRLVQALTHEPIVVGDDDAQLLEREAAELLERFLAQLDDDKRAVFVLAELEQQTAGEIASVLGIKENTVYSRLRAARQEFDRSCARLRLRDQRVVEREALLGRARRAHEPSLATRERVLAALLVPGLWGMSAGAASATPAAQGGGLFAAVSAVVSAPQVATLTAVLLGVLGGGAALLEAGRARAGAAEVSPVGARQDRREAADEADVPEDRLRGAAEDEVRGAGEDEGGQGRFGEGGGGAPGSSGTTGAADAVGRAGEGTEGRGEGEVGGRDRPHAAVGGSAGGRGRVRGEDGRSDRSRVEAIAADVAGDRQGEEEALRRPGGGDASAAGRQGRGGQVGGAVRADRSGTRAKAAVEPADFAEGGVPRGRDGRRMVRSRASGVAVPEDRSKVRARAGEAEQGEGRLEAVREDRPESGASAAGLEVVPEDMSLLETAARPRGSEPAAGDATTPADAANDLAREAGLIGAARRAIRERAWDRALGLLAAHAIEFPDGTLRDERWLSQIVATCASGQVEAARAKVERLARERPALARKAGPLCPGGEPSRPDTASGE